MITNSRKILLAASFLFLGSFAKAADTVPPNGITGFTAATGALPGSVKLSWTATGDDGYTGTAFRYVIKYRVTTIPLADADWPSATPVDGPPLNMILPAPLAAGSTQSVVITGLSPDVSYGFLIRAFDEVNLASPILANSATAYARSLCTGGLGDGEGTAVVSTPTFKAGAYQTITTTITIGANGIEMGGAVLFRVPDGWLSPNTSNPGFAGYTSFSASVSSVTLAMNITGREARFNVTAGSLGVGDKIFVSYIGYNCQVGSVATFLIKTQGTACGILTDIASSPSVTTVGGDPTVVSFENFTYVIPLGATVPVRVIVRDQCWNVTTTTSPKVVFLDPVRYEPGNPFAPDTDAEISISTSPISWAAAGSRATMTISVGISTKTFFYRLNSMAFKPNNQIRLSYPESFPPYNMVNYNAMMNPLLTGITNSSIDNGTFVNGQKTASLSPDGDFSNDEVYIRATLPDNLQWFVDISSNGFATMARRFNGWGSQINLAWSGDLEFLGGQPNTGPSIAPSGTYAIKIYTSGEMFVDTSLSATLSTLGISGRILDVSSNPVAGVEVNVFGPIGGRMTLTRPDGTYSFSGLRAGNYQLRAAKVGYSTREYSLPPLTSSLVLPDIFVDQLSVLRLTVLRPNNGDLSEVWGSVNAYDMNWQENVYRSVHFSVGKTTADAGNNWEVTPSTTIDISFSPNKPFSVRFQMSALGTADLTGLTLLPGQTTSQTILLTRRPDITGYVRVPAGTNSGGMWISVDARRSGNNQQFYGGAYLPPGEATGTYRVYGVVNGTYQLRANAPGFIASTKTATVSGGFDADNIDFPVFSEGGVVGGSVTVLGDTTPMGFGGFINLPINMWSRENFTGAGASVSLPVDATVTTGSYQLKGLADGVYDANVWLPGFEVVPPGPKFVNVVGGSGTLNITLQKHSGVLTGSINLGGGTDYENVLIDLMPFGQQFSVPISTYGNPFTGTYTIPRIGTDFYTLRAQYTTSGLMIERSVRIINGQTTTLNLDMSGDTYDISGRVSTEVESLAYFVNNTASTTINTPTGQASMAAHRIEAFRVQGREMYNQGTAASNACVTPFRDPKNWFSAQYGEDGNYTIRNLSPGIYKLVNNAEMDNDCTTGKEIAESSKIIAIIDDDLTDQNFVLKRGVDITGSIKLVNGFESGRNIEISVKQIGEREEITLARQVVYLSGSEAFFTMSHIPEGDYVLAAYDFQSPRKYAADQIPLKVGSSNITGKEIKLYSISKIQGQLRIKTSGELVTSTNYQSILSDRFFISAQANPWRPGGYNGAEYPLIGADGKFSILSGPGSYDLYFRNDEFTEDSLARGFKALVTTKLAGVKVEAGQIKDLGVIELSEGVTLTGTVTDGNGVPLPNIPMEARTKGGGGQDSLAAFTNHLGQYTLTGLDKEKTRYYDIYCAKRIEAGDQRFRGLTGPTYEQVVKANVDLQSVTNLNFTTQLAQGSIKGRIKIPSGGTTPLTMPFGDIRNQPGAAIIANKEGNIPTSNPIGDIEDEAGPDGSFTLKGLAKGRYKLVALGLGYGSVSKIVDVGTGETDIGDLTLVSGAKLSGSIYLQDGVSQPDSNTIGTLVAVSDGFSDILIAQLTENGSTITGYELSGFKQNKSYSILGFPEDDSNVVTLASGLIVNSDATKDLKVGDVAPKILPTVTTDDNGDLIVKFEFTAPLDNSDTDLDGNGIADNSDPDEICTLAAGAGTLGTGELASDRRSFTVAYTPVAGEESFTIAMNVIFNKENSEDGANYSKEEDFTFYPGIGGEITVQVANASGGEADLQTSAFSAPPGIFGDDAEAVHDIKFRSSALLEHVVGNVPLSGAGASSMAKAERLGYKGYPPEMASAMKRAKILAVDPLSSYYDVFLPVGVSHFFPEGREANLCLTYDSSDPDASDPYSLNVYYFNPKTGEYLLENENRLVDTVNERICVDISHASIFTVMASSASVITTGDAYAGELRIMNFPNPFNLKSKTVSRQNATPSSFDTTGTVIKMSIPSSMSGSVEIEIFNVLGEKVRTLHDNISAGGNHFYLEWDGKNEKGEKVASGTYIGRFTIGGAEERFFKMAVLK